VSARAFRTALAVLLVGCSSVAWAQGDFDLEATAIKGIYDTPFELLCRHFVRQDELPVLLPKALAGKTASSFKGAVAGHDTFVFVVPSDPQSGLYIDWNGNGDFSDDSPVPVLKTDYDPVRRTEGERIYGPIEVPAAGSGGRLAARFFVYVPIQDGRIPGISLFPAAYRGGSVRLGGAAYRTALIDADFDGCYNKITDDLDGYSREFDSDCFAIDLNNDGEFDRETERWPLTRLIRVDGVFYELRVVPDGSKVRLARADPKFELGRLEVGSPCHELTVFTPSVGVITLSGPQGAWNLPEGEYLITRSRLVMDDEEGARWELNCNLWSRPGARFKIVKGEILKHDRGLPLEGVLTLTRRRIAGEGVWAVDITCGIQGRGGESYSCRPKKDGVDTDVANAQILDEKGRLLDSGHVFKTFTWRVPPGFKGAFCARISPQIGPFEVTTPVKWYTVDTVPDAK
jgi:hypothetical protein